MSLEQMQIALAELIRLPEHNRKEDYEAFVQRYDLDENEKKQIEKLSKDWFVVKYGRTMGHVRWETIVKQTPYSKKFWEDDTAEYVWKHLFEPTAKQIGFKKLGAGYLNFIQSSQKAIDAFLKSGPPFIVDLLKFEAAQANVRIENIRPELSVPEGSLLRHRAFSVDRYQYKLSTFIYQLTRANQTDPQKLAPQLQEEYLLVLPKAEKSTHCRFFEVDAEIHDFLHAVEKGEETSRLPEAYPSLVELGLVRSLS